MDRRTFLAAGAGASPAQVTTASESIIQPNQRIAPPPMSVARSLPNVTLRTQDNKEVRLYEDLLKDKIVVINMFYVSCLDGACPRVTANLARLQTLLGPRLGRDTFMYSITLQPDLDTPKRLKEYMTNFNIGPGWVFLTGKKSDIDPLRRKLGYWDPDPKLDALATTHAGMAMMGNEPLDRWMGCPTMAEPREIKRVLSYLDWPKGWPSTRAESA